MKKLFAALLILSSCLTSWAQTVKDSFRPWEQEALTWDWFMGHSKSDSMVYNLAWNFKYKYQIEKINGIHYAYCDVLAGMDCTDSYAHLDYRNPQGLKYCRLLFDLVELYSRKVTIDLAKDVESSFQQINKFYVNQLEYRMNEVKQATNNGRDAAMLELCCATVAREMQEAEFHPERIDYEGSTRGIGMYIGFYTNMPFTDYVDRALYGLDFGWEYSSTRHHFMLDVGLSGGSKVGKDFMTSNGLVAQGESLKEAHFSLGYGYCLNPKSARSFVPFAEVGFATYDGPNVTIDGKKEGREKGCLMTALGCYYNIPLRQTVGLSNSLLLMGGTSSPSHSMLGIRLKPYVGLNYNDTFGWVPNVNLSIQFYMNSKHH